MRPTYALGGLLLLLLLVALGSGNAGAMAARPVPSPGSSGSTLPSAPLGVIALPENSAVNLSWSPPASDGGTKLTGYVIEFSPVMNGTGKLSIGPTTHTWIAGLTNGVLYDFQVAARNNVGVGPLSSPPAQARPGSVPLPPTGVSVTTANASATVSWVPPPPALYYPVQGYLVNLTQDGKSKVIATAHPPANLTGLVDGAPYRVSVRAVNSFGDSPASKGVTFTPYGPPAAPPALSISYDALRGAVEVSWSAPRWTGGAPIDNFTIRWLASSGAVGVAHAGPNATSWTLPGAGGGLTYSFSLEATGRGGVGAATTATYLVPVSGAASPFSSPLLVLGELLLIVLLVFLVLRAASRGAASRPARPPPPAPAPFPAWDTLTPVLAPGPPAYEEWGPPPGT